MAITLGATFSGIEMPRRYTGIGPFLSSAGNVYAFPLFNLGLGGVAPQKASDPMASFSAMTTKSMSSSGTTQIEAMSCYQVGDVIHIATQIASGAVYYNQFDMSTDTWVFSTSETVFTPAIAAPTALHTFVSLVVRSTGEVVCVFANGLNATMNGVNSVAIKLRSTGGVWADNAGGTAVTASTIIDNGGSIDWGSGLAVLGASDRVHFFMRDGTTSPIPMYQRTLTQANALQTWQSSFGNGSTVAGSIHTWMNGTAYESGGSTIVALNHRNSGSGTNRVHMATLTSSDAPTVSHTQVSATAPAINSTTANQAMCDSRVNAADLHALWTSSGGFYSDVNSGSGWGTDTQESATGYLQYSSNKINRSGVKIGLILAPTVGGPAMPVYGEISLTAPDTTAPGIPTGLNAILIGE